MNKIYKDSDGERAVSRLLKISAVVIMVMVWILIDKGNIYGQNAAKVSSVSKTLHPQTIQSPQFKGGDGGDGGDGGEGSGGEGGGVPPSDDGGFVIKPNPVQTDLVFDFEFTVRTAIPVQIYDPLGRLVDQQVFQPGLNSQKLDFSKYQTGMYLVRLDLGNRVEVRRVIKK
ncbi:MAG: T9SS type A sorting domain-containing protein [Flavobacteriales bacterium]|nr:T9SS type A sorting domain-containing protein [Flavobacteriales bacterium]